MNEKTATIVPETDGALAIYMVLTYKGKIYGNKIRFEHELEKGGQKELIRHFSEQGRGLLSSAERTLREIKKQCPTLKTK